MMHIRWRGKKVVPVHNFHDGRGSGFTARERWEVEGVELRARERREGWGEWKKTAEGR